MDYILMNKDVPCAPFSCEQDEFGEKSAVLREWYTDLRPIGLQSLTAWLEKRRAPKRRKHMEQLLEQYGCVGLEGFLRVTHALSLNDTFWVKEESETLCWDEVSLYRNEFDALIAQAAFSGIIRFPRMRFTEICLWTARICSLPRRHRYILPAHILHQRQAQICWYRHMAEPISCRSVFQDVQITMDHIIFRKNSYR